jgi:hypothetical protein
MTTAAEPERTAPIIISTTNRRKTAVRANEMTTTTKSLTERKMKMATEKLTERSPKLCPK